MIPNETIQILIVDDEPNNLIALSAVLASIAERIVTAQSGEEALRHLLATDFAVILLDVHMPDMDGFETAAFIRARERSMETPIIFVTGTAEMQTEITRLKGYSLGAVDYLFKPVTPEILRSKVEVFVNLAKSKIKLQRLNDQLRDQTAQLQLVNRELEAFSYSASHDLAAPLHHILRYADFMRKEDERRLSATGQEYLTRIENAAKRMEELIEDLLALSRVTRAKMRKSPLNLTAMAKEVIGELETAAPGRKIQYIVPDNLTAEGDPSLIKIVLTNLVGNAWKYTQSHDRATIEIGSENQEGKGVYFVRDDGAGFDLAYADRLFGPFQRLHSESEFMGTGIGLAIVQRIIHRHSGEVWAKGAVEKGATFYFTLG